MGDVLEKYLKNGERIDDLQRDGLKIIQNPEGFCFGIDAVLLSSFAKVKSGDTVVDLGTGTGIIPLLLSAKTVAKKIYGIEIQDDVAEMANRSVKMNDLGDKIEIINDDLKNALEYIPSSSVDVITSNPPYMLVGTGEVSPTRSLSRHEIKCSLDDVISCANKLLKTKGKLFLVHRANRMVDVIDTMRKHKIEPKRLRCVHPFEDKEANLILVEGIKNAGREMKIIKPLIVRDNGGQYTEEIYAIYEDAGVDSFR